MKRPSRDSIARLLARYPVTVMWFALAFLFAFEIWLLTR